MSDADTIDANSYSRDLTLESTTAVVLVNWNGWRDTIECLASLLALQRRPALIIIVDNDSRDDSVAHIEAWCRGEKPASLASSSPGLPQFDTRAPPDLAWVTHSAGGPRQTMEHGIVVLRSPVNAGFAGGNNLGIRFALDCGMSLVWLLNTDTIVERNALSALLNRAQHRPDAGMIGSTLVYYWRPERIQALGGASFNIKTGVSQTLGSETLLADVPSDPAPIERRTDFVVGASMLLTRAFIESIGSMTEDYFLYYEEIDWAVRAKGRFAIAYAPASRVFHKVGGSSRKTANRISLRYLYRNRLVFMQRFYPQSLNTVFRHLIREFLSHMVRGDWVNAREILGALAGWPRQRKARS